VGLCWSVVFFVGGFRFGGWLCICFEGSVVSMNVLIEKMCGFIVYWEIFLVVISWFMLIVGVAIIFYGLVLWRLWSRC
jgi:hypothetical protein